MSYPYQNQPGYPPPYPPPPPPRKSNTGLIVGLAVFAAVAVIVLVVVLVVKGGDSNSSNSSGSSGSVDTADVTGSAEALGKKGVQLIENHDVDGATPLLCKTESKFPRSLQALDGKDTTVVYKGTKETSDTAAEVSFTLSLDGKSKDNKFSLAKKDGKWCIN